jgi:tRNA(Ile)-lysidine synthase
VSFSIASLGAALERLMPRDATGMVIGLSGGVDSSCLAVATVQFAAAAGSPPVRAVHVDHGLQPAAGVFRERCAALCQSLRIPLAIIAVPVDMRPGVSIEAAARDARYAALAAQLAVGECLLTAHHREDQAETLLLQALRGAGPKGLACMPSCRALGAGWHLRPLLSVARPELLQFAAAHAIDAVADPMNQDLRFDRAYLRQRIWPRLMERWPGAGSALARTADHAAEAQALLDSIADVDLSDLRDGEGLSVLRLRRLGHARQINALRRWILHAAAVPPPSARLTEALRQMLDAHEDHLPAVFWGQHALRRYRDRIFLTAAAPPRLQSPLTWDWRTQPVLDLGDGVGRLRAVSQTGGLAIDKVAAGLVVRRRAGGEKIKPGRSAATQSVQHLCQSRGLLPWARDALPFIFAGDDLVAIGDLWSSARWCAAAGIAGLGLRWELAPIIC